MTDKQYQRLTKKLNELITEYNLFCDTLNNNVIDYRIKPTLLQEHTKQYTLLSKKIFKVLKSIKPMCSFDKQKTESLNKLEDCVLGTNDFLTMKRIENRRASLKNSSLPDNINTNDNKNNTNYSHNCLKCRNDKDIQQNLYSTNKGTFKRVNSRRFI